jgi:hypothetical protein
LLPVAAVPLPEGVQPPSEESDELQEEEVEPGKGPERWHDLGLQFLH